MEIVSDSVDEIVVKLTRLRISSFEFFDVIISSITKESFFLIFGKKTRDLTCRQDHIDELQKLFFFDLWVSKNEAAISAETTCDFEVFFNIFLEIFFSIVLYQLNLLVIHSLNKGRQTSEGLFTTTTNTHK